ncbi:MAG: hypothetical protein AAFZ15_26460 [Bacteroidota bacterium]
MFSKKKVFKYEGNKQTLTDVLLRASNHSPFYAEKILDNQFDLVLKEKVLVWRYHHEIRATGYIIQENDYSLSIQIEIKFPGYFIPLCIGSMIIFLLFFLLNKDTWEGGMLLILLFPISFFFIFRRAILEFFTKIEECFYLKEIK